MNSHRQWRGRLDPLDGLELVRPRRGHRPADHPFKGGLDVLRGERAAVVKRQAVRQGELERARIEHPVLAREIAHRLALVVEGDQPRRDELRHSLPDGGQGKAGIQAVRYGLDEDDDALAALLWVAANQRGAYGG